VPVEPVRYAGFMLLALTAIVCASIALFLGVQGAFMHAQKEIYLKAGPLLLAAVVLAKLLADQARQIKAHPEPRGFTNLLKASLAVALMFLTVAGVVGWQLGVRRFAFTSIVKDWVHLNQVANRISDQRNAAEDISAQLEMYKAIQADVADMEKTASRLLEQETRFVDRYPDYGRVSQKEIPDIQVLLNRAQLLQREIEAARNISAQQEQQRALLWAKQMQPLLDEEAALDRNNPPQATTDDD
jgi:hypothetical protein